jgi:SAM-dependent methyltransferase
VIEALAPDTVGQVEAAHRGMWGRVADLYEQDVEALTGGGVEAILDAVDAGGGTLLLDVGTGPGTLLGPALARGARVRAVDLSAEMIAHARARHPDVDAEVANAAALPFEDGTFDAVTMPYSLHHMAEPDVALAEAHRVLRGGGRVACTVWAPQEELVAFGLGFGPLAELPVEVAMLPGVPLDAAESPELIGLLGGAGFVDVELRELATGWDLTDPSGLIALMDRLLALGDHGPEVQRQYADAVRRDVAAWKGSAGTSVAPNPTRLLSGRKAG